MVFACRTIFHYQVKFVIKIINYYNQFYQAQQMSHFTSSIIKGLDASRRIESDLALEKHQQDLSKIRLQRELEGLSRSRRNFIDQQLAQAQVQYEEKLREDPKISEDYLNRRKRAEAQRAKVAQQDFERQRGRLIKERNLYDDLDKQHRVIQKAILDLKTRSKRAEQDEEREIIDLRSRRQGIEQLLLESRQRENYHYNQSKRLAEF